MSVLKEDLSSDTLEAVFETFVSQERKLIDIETAQGFKSPGSGKLPEIKVKGLRWYQYARKIAEKGGPLKILELGAGDDAAAWTGGIDGSKMNKEVLRLRQEGIPFEVTVQSRRCLPKKPEGVNRFMTGHFLDVLNQLERQGEKFQIVLSRWSLYYTIAVFEILDRVDRILAANGTVYLEEVYRGPGNSKALVFSKGLVPKGLLTHRLIYDLTLSPKQACVGGLPFIEKEGHDHVGWKKGELDRSKLPKFVGAAQFAGNSELWLGLFEAR